MNIAVSCPGGTRREFLRGAARYSLFSLLAGLTAAQAWKGRKSCRNQGICGPCPAFADCTLPPALAKRRFGGG